MHPRWKQLCDRLLIPDLHAIRVWNLLESMYSTPGRYYHTMEHITEMIDVFYAIKYEWPIQFGANLEFAIWFHDVVYNVTRTDNEALSGILFENVLGHHMRGITKDKTLELIQMTATHVPTMISSEMILCDLDLMRLADTWANFVRYNENIRKEYLVYYDAQEYDKGRNVFLRSLLDRHQIYHTTFFRNKCEAVARENIARIIRITEKR